MTLVIGTAPHNTWRHAVEGVEEQRKQNPSAIRCGVCYYSIVLNAHRVTSMADTDISWNEKKSEYDKQYSMIRKLLLQQQASTSSETELVWKQKKAEYVNKVQPIRVKIIRIAAIRVTCMSDLRHIHDPVLSSLKMEGIRLLLSWRLFTARHVSGVLPPIIRSSMTAVADFVSWW
jgi:hypothetical protein